jgi:hypothetical protein
MSGVVKATPIGKSYDRDAAIEAIEKLATSPAWAGWERMTDIVATQSMSPGKGSTWTAKATFVRPVKT